MILKSTSNRKEVKRSSQTYQLAAFRSSYFSADHRSPVVSFRISRFTKTDCAAVALNKKSRPRREQSRSTVFPDLHIRFYFKELVPSGCVVSPSIEDFAARTRCSRQTNWAGAALN